MHARFPRGGGTALWWRAPDLLLAGCGLPWLCFVAAVVAVVAWRGDAPPEETPHGATENALHAMVGLTCALWGAANAGRILRQERRAAKRQLRLTIEDDADETSTHKAKGRKDGDESLLGSAGSEPGAPVKPLAAFPAFPATIEPKPEPEFEATDNPLGAGVTAL